MVVGNYEKFCKNFHLCEGYEKAINSSEDYSLHHIQGEYMSKEELKEYDWYFDCHPSCLKWVTKSEHSKIHIRCMRFETRWRRSESQKGRVMSPEARKNNSEAQKGKVLSDETRKKISLAKKGKVFSEEHRKNLSLARKGEKNPQFGKSWKLVNGKRIYSESKK